MKNIMNGQIHVLDEEFQDCLQSSKKPIRKSEAIKKGLIKAQSGDLLKKLQIILKIELFLYEEWLKTESEQYIRKEIGLLFDKLDEDSCISILEAIRCAANAEGK